jgi:hypothetical protein
MTDQTNGKAESFTRTMLAGWAYGPTYASGHVLTRALQPARVTTVNRHTALGRQPPVRTKLLGSHN